MSVEATTDLRAAAREAWDAVVVGAGPSGALAARELARAGRSALLVDRASFPRWKVCGACLNGRALDVLASAGLGGLVERRGGVPLSAFRVWAGGRSARIGLPRGVAISRARLDAALVEAAIEAGAAFLPETRAALGPVEGATRRLALRGADGAAVETGARVAIAADGLGGSFIGADLGPRREESARSRVGAGGTLRESPAFLRPGTIYMAVARGGYAGLVRVEDGTLNVGAALDRALVRERGGLGPAIAACLREAGLPAVPGIEEASWKGTATLTRGAARPAAERLLLVGDAARYVEPFTGEGMAWALASAAAAAPFVAAAAGDWRPEHERRWAELFERRIGRPQRRCRAIAWGLRRPLLVRAAVAALAGAPALAAPLVRGLDSAPRAGRP